LVVAPPGWLRLYGRLHVGSVVRSRTTFGATVDASQKKLRRRFRGGGRTPRGDAALATDDARINDRIRARQVRLIGADGAQLGVRTLPDALGIARESGLDLVEVAANAEPPVCKIMDYGKYKYEQDQRRKESRKRASNVVIKEMKFRPKIDSHDYDTKMKHVERFLEEGSKVKLTIMFRGREMAHPELGRRILEKVAERVAEIAIVESAPKQDGRNMVMVLNPIRKPKAKTAAQAANV
jgi:translation initiation factor IF-3